MAAAHRFATALMAAALFVSRHFRLFAWTVYAAVAAERIGALILHPDRIYTGREWSITFYFANYVDHGFLRRGLVGTLLRPLVTAVEDPFPWLLALMALLNLALVAVLIELVARRLPHRDRPDMAVFLRIAVILGSGGVMQWMNEHGNLDQVNFLILLGALALVARGHIVAAGVAAVAGVLVHEAFAVFALPLLAAAAWERGGLRPSLSVAVPGALAALALAAYGGSETAQAIPHGIGQVAWRRGLFEVEDEWSARDLILTLWYWLAIGALLLWWWMDNGRAQGLYLLAAFAPVMLNVFGTDHPRWIGIGLAVALIALCHGARVFGWRAAGLSPARAAAALVLILPFGPLSQVGLHPWMK